MGRQNAKVYDIVDASVTLTEAQMLEVESKFGDGGRGLEYLDWVRAHSNSDKQSAQLRYQKSLDELMIAPTATAAEINTVFEIIETVWPKLIDKSGPRNEQIRLALDLIPESHHAHSVADRFSTDDIMGFNNLADKFDSFASFKVAFIEMIDVKAIKKNVTEHSTLAFARWSAARKERSQSNPRRDPAGQCHTCPIRCCEGAPNKCCVFSDKMPQIASIPQKQLIQSCRDYIKSNPRSPAPRPTWAGRWDPREPPSGGVVSETAYTLIGRSKPLTV